ncbi:hypothetical protein QGN29_01270 [Temperatibacter marinus]|uniref:Uncharacterized protein n=1 Tax=Temperatibacter marinus TaxID=1456591 RepID=A0AA52H9J9_9PROT|nr:hypothetical protein [Temperatibacter marinus]WND02994.1 hypothetical protein QGN29_01270 [Temperatibacter marinus]
MLNSAAEIIQEIAKDDGALVLPEGAVLRKVTLYEPLIIALPAPVATTYFWFHKGQEVRSFQGPVCI